MNKPFNAVISNAILCMLNSKYIHSSLAPWYLLAGIEAYCGQSVCAEVVEGTVNMALNDVADRLVSKRPSVIGFCCYIWNIAFVKKLLPVIKNALPDVVVIFGGPEVSFNAGEILRDEPLVDYVISGEGELPFAQLLNAITSGGEAAGMPGVCYRDGGTVVVTPPYCPSDEPPNPYSDAYFKALNGRIAYLETSRGCPFSCAFCLSGRMGGVRFFDLERAKHDLLLLSKSGTQTIKFVDRTFNADRRRAREIFGFIIENYGQAIPDSVRFHFEIAGDLLDDETFDLLETAPRGVFQFEIGLQSFNPRTLEAINRKTDIERLKSNIARLVSLDNIHIHIDLITGLPHEDFDSFAESFNTAYALKPHMLQLGFLKLLHGSPMRAPERQEPEAFPCRYSSDPPYEVLETPWLSAGELKKLHDAEDALERLYNSGRFRRTLLYVLEQTGLTPFELFLRAGDFISEKITGKSSLDDFTAVIFEFFASLRASAERYGADRMALRDLMVCDRLATNSTGRLPKALQIMDDGLKNAVISLNRQEDTRLLKGIKRGYALLYSENGFVCVDYACRDPVTGEYVLRRYHLDDLL